MGVFRRFYRVRRLSALLLCLPGILLCLWYAWKAYARFDRYRRHAGAEVALTLEDFHIQLFDVLRRDLRRMGMPPPPAPPAVERITLRMSSQALDTLRRGADREAKRKYAPARLVAPDGIHEVEVRLRGNRHWHLLGRQKSMKIRLEKGDLFEGLRVFNLINEPTPLVVGEEIILELARELGLITPPSGFRRVHVNGADLGVFHREAQPDESLLRLHRRVPGGLYSGNLAPSAPERALWGGPDHWKKVAWRDEASKEDRAALENLLSTLRTGSIRAFDAFARERMDLRRFALFECLDIVFGGDQHDFRENHKLYFDPYRGRWEPVAWNFRAFKHDPVFNLAENPILLRLKMVPGYLAMRDRLLYRLLVDEASTTAVRARGLAMLRRILPELVTDPYWDAYKLLPDVSSFHRRMVRPMDARRLALVFESEMRTFAQRHAYLLRAIERHPLWILTGRPEEDDPEAPSAVHLLVDGRAGVRLESFRAAWPEGCSDPGWQVLREGRAVTPVSHGELVELDRPLDLWPGVVLAAWTDADPATGRVRARPSPVSYPFVLRAACRPDRIEAEAVHLATGARIRSRPATDAVIARVPARRLGPDDVPRLVAGEAGPHPWSLPAPALRDVELGPGRVEVPATRVFGPGQTVRVAPGTRLIMGAGASLVFLGPLHVEGKRAAPVVIEPASDEPWGGIALQGPGTAGSRLRCLVATGGSRPSHGLVAYPAMIDIHDTRDITVSGCRFGHNRGGGDVLHAVYVEGLFIEDTRVEAAAVDALDLEFVTAGLARVSVLGAGDEGVDLMGARVRMDDSLVVGAAGNAVSAGEETVLRVRDSLLARSGVGVLAKNASRVEVSDCLLYRNRTGVRVYRRTVRYAGDSRVDADVLFVVGSERAVRRDDCKRDVLESGRIQQRLPRAGALDHLARDVLQIEGFGRLDERLDELGAGVRP